MTTILPRLETAADPDFSRWDLTDKSIILTSKFQAVLKNMNTLAQAFSCIGLHDDYLKQLDTNASPAQGYGFIAAEVFADDSEQILEAQNRLTFTSLEALVADTLGKIKASAGSEIRLYFLEPRSKRPAPPVDPEAAVAVKPVPQKPLITAAVAELEETAEAA